MNDSIKEIIQLQPKLATEEIEEEKEEVFTSMLNGTVTNQLISINSSKIQPKIDIETGDATIEQGTVKVSIEGYSRLTRGLRISTSKLLDVCTIFLTKNNNYKGSDEQINPTVIISLEQFMKLCGIPNTKASKDKTRRKVKEDLNILYHMSMKWKENGKKDSNFLQMRLCEKIAILRGNIIFSFSADMAKYLTNAYVTQYPIELLKLDERNSNAFILGRKIWLHNGNYNNQNRGTANILSVASLLSACPTIPSYDEVMNTDRHVDKRIRERLENGLDAINSLSTIKIKWEYSNAKGLPLKENQLDLNNYKNFSELYIKYDITNAPDQSERLERRKNKIEAQQLKRNPAKRKKAIRSENT